MIYTITTNPSLDYYMDISKSLDDNNYHRSISEMYGAGGKGVNVSIFLSGLGMSSSALGFLGGFTKSKYINSVAKYPDIQPLFTTIKDDTRINVKVKTDQEIYLNAKGPTITDEEFDKFKERLEKVYDSDIVVLSGNIQEELKDRIVEAVGGLIKSGTKVILDTSEDVVERCLEFHPYLVRVNERKTSMDENIILKNSKTLLDKGALNVVYSSSLNKSYYFVNKDFTYRTERENDFNVGIGFNDSFIAGIIYGIVRGATEKEMFQIGVVSSLGLSLTSLYSEPLNVLDCFESINVSEL